MCVNLTLKNCRVGNMGKRRNKRKKMQLATPKIKPLGNAVVNQNKITDKRDLNIFGIHLVKSFSSSSVSSTLDPSSTDPARLPMPALNSIKSARVVFPAAPCPTSATLRMSSTFLAIVVLDPFPEEETNPRIPIVSTRQFRSMSESSIL